MNWIKLEDRRPQHGAFVLAYSPKYGMHTTYFNGAGGLNEFLSRSYEIPGITHWRVLPDAPSENNQAKSFTDHMELMEKAGVGPNDTFADVMVKISEYSADRIVERLSPFYQKNTPNTGPR